MKGLRIKNPDTFHFSLKKILPAKLIKIVAAVYVFTLAGIIFLADTNGTIYFSFLNLLPFGDKIGHFCLVGMFAFVINSALQTRTIRFWKLHYLFGSLIVLGVVTAEEFSQIFVRGRTFDLMDLAADAAGIFVFGEIARRIFGKKSIFLRGSV